MWAGMFNAVHYLDHFSFLTEKLSKVQGIFSTYFSFKTGKDWSLAFKMTVINKMENKNDGFVFYLAKDAPEGNDVNANYQRNLSFYEAAVN